MVMGAWSEGLVEAEMQVASIQNGYYVALCNRTGTETKQAFAGESFACDPAGKVIAKAGQLSDETLMCDIDLDKELRAAGIANILTGLVAGLDLH